MTNECSGLAESRPATLVVLAEAAAEDFKKEFEIARIARTIDHGESTSTQCRGDLAAVIAMGAGTLDDDGGWGLAEAGEQFEEPRTGLLGRWPCGGLIERQAKIDNGNMDRGLLNDLRRLFARVCPERVNAQRLEEAGKAIDPGVGVPACVRKEEIETPSPAGR